MTNFEQIKTAVRQAMQSQGLSADQLARRTGIGRDSIYRYLAGTQRLPSDKLEVLVAELGIRVIRTGDD
jgi:transcriptional regulator with XRE-family HTH domain